MFELELVTFPDISDCKVVFPDVDDDDCGDWDIDAPGGNGTEGEIDAPGGNGIGDENADIFAPGGRGIDDTGD